MLTLADIQDVRALINEALSEGITIRKMTASSSTGFSTLLFRLDHGARSAELYFRISPRETQ